MLYIYWSHHSLRYFLIHMYDCAGSATGLRTFDVIDFKRYRPRTDTRLVESTTTLYRDREIKPECQRFAVHDEACRVVEVAYLWHEGGFPCPCTKWWLIIFLLSSLLAVRNPNKKSHCYTFLAQTTGSLVLDHSIWDGDLARGIHALPCKVKQSNAFSHMRLRKHTESLVLDRSIRDGDLARGINALSCKSKQSNASPIVGIIPLRRWPWRQSTNAIFPGTSQVRLAVVALAWHCS